MGCGDVPHDGNCWFTLISQFLSGHPNRHMEIRHRVVDAEMADYPSLAAASLEFRDPYSLLCNALDFDTLQDYQAKMKTPGVSAGLPEIGRTAQLFDLVIYLYIVPSFKDEAVKQITINKGGRFPVKVLGQNNHFMMLMVS